MKKKREIIKKLSSKKDKRCRRNHSDDDEISDAEEEQNPRPKKKIKLNSEKHVEDSVVPILLVTKNLSQQLMNQIKFLYVKYLGFSNVCSKSLLF